MTGAALIMLAYSVPGSLLMLSFGLAMSIGTDAIYEGHLMACLVLKADMDMWWCFVSCACLALLCTLGLVSICNSEDALPASDPFTFLWLALLCLFVIATSISAVSTSVHLRQGDEAPHKRYIVCRLLLIPLIDVITATLLFLLLFLRDTSFWCGIAVLIGIQAILSIGEPAILFSGSAAEHLSSPPLSAPSH